jgi:hypothetical protein
MHYQGTDAFGVGGGAGGGAIVIASSTSIVFIPPAVMTAVGGNGLTNWGGGGGSGGAIRLVAPTISGTGTFNVSGGTSGGAPSASQGGPGWIRLEGYLIGTQFNVTSNAVSLGSPVGGSALRPAGSIRVTAIDGTPLPVNPSGSFQMPDVTISKTTSVNVDIQATGIPTGTVVTLQVYPETPVDLTTVNLPTAQATLTGTLQSSTATAAFTFPWGFSRGFVRASW